MAEGETNSEFGNIGGEVTVEQFQALPTTLDMLYFLGKDGTSGSFRIRRDMRSTRLELGLPDDYALKNVPDGFDYYKDERKLVYPAGSVIPKGGRPNQRVRAQPEDYHMDFLQPRIIDGHPNQITVDNLADKLKELSGDEVIIYTGAGISTAGEKPVWNGRQLKKALGLVDNLAANGINGFIDYCIANPENIVKVVEQFDDQLFSDNSTPAHEAIAKLIKAKPGIYLCTENLDHKHEAQGSRIRPSRFGGQSTFDSIRKADKVKVLITVGLSHDDRSVIGYLKEHNPELEIVAFTRSGEIKPYLGDEDFMVVGDCQETLPELVRMLEEKK